MIKKVQVLAGISDKSKKLAVKLEKLLSSFDLVAKDPDLYIVAGGDGTLLHWLNQLNYPSIPFLGVDAGSLGYFQEVGEKDLKDLAKQLAAGKYSLQKFPLLELSSGKKIIAHSFNEFAIERASARAVHLAIELDGYFTGADSLGRIWHKAAIGGYGWLAAFMRAIKPPAAN